MNELQQFTDHIWTVSSPLRLAGMEMGTRSTVVELPSGGLVIISPIEFDDELAGQIEELGDVDTVIAPNLLHHLYFNDACRRWPQARALVPPGLADKTKLVDRAVSMGHRGAIEDSLQWCVVDGAPKVGEHVFVDRRDEVLVLTDLAFHFVDHPQFWLRLMMHLNGVYGRFGPSRLLRRMIADRQSFSESLREILGWNWDAIIVTHGRCIDGGGRQLFLEGFSDFL